MNRSEYEVIITRDTRQLSIDFNAMSDAEIISMLNAFENMVTLVKNKLNKNLVN